MKNSFSYTSKKSAMEPVCSEWVTYPELPEESRASDNELYEARATRHTIRAYKRSEIGSEMVCLVVLLGVCQGGNPTFMFICPLDL